MNDQVELVTEDLKPLLQVEIQESSMTPREIRRDSLKETIHQTRSTIPFEVTKSQHDAEKELIRNVIQHLVDLLSPAEIEAIFRDIRIAEEEDLEDITLIDAIVRRAEALVESEDDPVIKLLEKNSAEIIPIIRSALKKYDSHYSAAIDSKRLLIDDDIEEEKEVASTLPENVNIQDERKYRRGRILNVIIESMDSKRKARILEGLKKLAPDDHILEMIIEDIIEKHIARLESKTNIPLNLKQKQKRTVEELLEIIGVDGVEELKRQRRDEIIPKLIIAKTGAVDAILENIVDIIENYLQSKTLNIAKTAVKTLLSKQVVPTAEIENKLNQVPHKDPILNMIDKAVERATEDLYNLILRAAEELDKDPKKEETKTMLTMSYEMDRIIDKHLNILLPKRKELGERAVVQAVMEQVGAGIDPTRLKKPQSRQMLKDKIFSKLI